MAAAIAQDESTWHLDEVMRRSPHAAPITDEEALRVIHALRAERAMIEVKQEKARAKKQGVEDAESDSDEPSNT